MYKNVHKFNVYTIFLTVIPTCYQLGAVMRHVHFQRKKKNEQKYKDVGEELRGVTIAIVVTYKPRPRFNPLFNAI